MRFWGIAIAVWIGLFAVVVGVRKLTSASSAPTRDLSEYLDSLPMKNGAPTPNEVTTKEPELLPELIKMIDPLREQLRPCRDLVLGNQDHVLFDFSFSLPTPDGPLENLALE